MAAANVLLRNLSIPAPDTNKLIFRLPCTGSTQGEEQNPAIIVVWGGRWRWTGDTRRWGLSSCYKGAVATRILRKYFKKIECGLHSWAEHPPHCLVSCPILSMANLCLFCCFRATGWVQVNLEEFQVAFPPLLTSCSPDSVISGDIFWLPGDEVIDYSSPNTDWELIITKHLSAQGELCQVFGE